MLDIKSVLFKYSDKQQKLKPDSKNYKKMSDVFALNLFIYILFFGTQPLLLSPPTVQLIEMFKADLNVWQNTLSEFLV